MEDIVKTIIIGLAITMLFKACGAFEPQYVSPEEYEDREGQYEHGFRGS